MFLLLDLVIFISGDTRKQPLRKATAATANLTEMTSELEVAGPSSGKSSPKKATKRPVTLEEVESSTKKLKLPQEDTSDEGTNRILENWIGFFKIFLLLFDRKIRK